MLLRHRACACIPLLIAISAMSARSVLAQAEANDQPGTALIGDMPKKDQPTKDGKAENPAGSCAEEKSLGSNGDAQATRRECLDRHQESSGGG